MQESHTESFIRHISFLIIIITYCSLSYLRASIFGASPSLSLFLARVYASVRRKSARGTTRALLALKIRATDICPGNAEACVQHVSRFKQKSHGRKLDS